MHKRFFRVKKKLNALIIIQTFNYISNPYGGLRMKRVLTLISLFIVFAFSSETCNVSNSAPGIPEKSCTQTGYVCNLAFDVNNAQNAISFYLGTDSLCTSIQTTSLSTVRASDNVTTNQLHLFLIESEQYHTAALTMTLSGAIALSASNNRNLIRVIYHKVNSTEYGGILLQAVSIVGN